MFLSWIGPQVATIFPILNLKFKHTWECFTLMEKGSWFWSRVLPASEWHSVYGIFPGRAELSCAFLEIVFQVDRERDGKKVGRVFNPHLLATGRLTDAVDKVVVNGKLRWDCRGIRISSHTKLSREKNSPTENSNSSYKVHCVVRWRLT